MIMPKVNVRETNPVLYAKVKSEQDKLREDCTARITVARLCPYCGHKITTIYKGNHGYATEKCVNCGENVIFPPISFRMANK